MIRGRELASVCSSACNSDLLDVKLRRPLRGERNLKTEEFKRNARVNNVGLRRATLCASESPLISSNLGCHASARTEHLRPTRKRTEQRTRTQLPASQAIPLSSVGTPHYALTFEIFCSFSCLRD